MAAMFSNNQQSLSHCNPNPNQPLSSSFFPFMDDPETLISRQITKKPRLASWGCGDGYFNKFGDICYNPNQSLASSIPTFFHEHQTLISQQITRLASPWWSVDKSLDELSVIFNKPPPITSNSTAGVSKPPPEVIVIDEDELIEEGIPELSDFIINNTLPISSSSSSVVSKPTPDLIVIDDDDEEETLAMWNDNNPKFDWNDNEQDSGSVVINSEKKNNNGGGGGFVHVSLDEWGETVEELKKIPWEAFDPNWEIKSAIMDPWLGPYIQQLTDF